MELRDIDDLVTWKLVNGNASLKEAATKMKTLDVGLIPVCDGDRLKGIADRPRYHDQSYGEWTRSRARPR